MDLCNKALLYWNHALLNSDLNHIPAGFSIAIDLAKMIEKIVISPYAPAWFVNTIQTFVTNSGLTAPVFQSDLLEPFFFH